MNEKPLASRLGDVFGLDTDSLSVPISEMVSARSKAESRPAASVVNELMRPDHPGWNKVLDGLFLGHTRFYRHPKVWEYLSQEARAFRPPVRALVAGCSTGQEAVTLGLMLDAVSPGRGFEIVAVDANESALDKARAGRYSLSEVESLPAAWIKRGFDLHGTSVTVASWLRNRIDYRWCNLVDGVPPGPFAVVTLRNVLTYMKPEAVTRILEHVLASLAAERGLLVVAPQETHLIATAKAYRVKAPGLPIYYAPKAAPAIVGAPAVERAAPVWRSAGMGPSEEPLLDASRLIEVGGIVVDEETLESTSEGWQRVERELVQLLDSPPRAVRLDLGAVRLVDGVVQRRLHALGRLLESSGTRVERCGEVWSRFSHPARQTREMERDDA